MASAGNFVNPPLDLEFDRSPVCKKARLTGPDDEATVDRWTLSKNELVLDALYDSGLDRLGSDSDADNKRAVQQKRKKKGRCGDSEDAHTPKRGCHNNNYNSNKSSSPREVQKEAIGVMEASLPENVLRKLAKGELDDVLLRETVAQPVMNFFDFLSDEVILQIFQSIPRGHLSNVALVCKRFSQLVEDESLWPRMDASNRTLGKGVMGVIMSRQVIILSLTKSRVLSPAILPNCKAALPDFNSRLMYLDLTMASVSIQALTDVFTICKRLKKLSLESVPISEDVLRALAGNVDLEVLNLAMCAGLNLSGIKCFLSQCKKLKEFNISWTYLNQDCIKFISRNLPRTLDRFNFSGCRKFLVDDDVSSIVTSCPNLRELDLSDCTAITGDSVRRLTGLKELNFLAMSRCYLVPYRSFLALRKLEALMYLDVHANYVNHNEMQTLKEGLGDRVHLNKFKFSSIARPMLGHKKKAIWNMKLRD